jgi:hypothetical protein
LIQNFFLHRTQVKKLLKYLLSRYSVSRTYFLINGTLSIYFIEGFEILSIFLVLPSALKTSNSVNNRKKLFIRLNIAQHSPSRGGGKTK